MEKAFALLAAIVASGFALDLWRSNLRRPRPHAAAWAAGVSLYALATWALVFGLFNGWSDTTFRVFFVFGAIMNIPILALGSVYLVLGDRAGRLFATFLVLFLGAGTWATLTAIPVGPVRDVGVPEGSEVFAMPLTEIPGGVSLPSPRLFAAIAGGLGTVIIVGLAVWSIVRSRGNRTVTLGNTFIVLGTLAPATGGSLTALGEGGGFALSLLVGAVLLWAGYRIASGQVVSIRRNSTADGGN